MVVIVGTGAGGAIIAMMLAKENIPVTILEKGEYIESADAFNYYDQKYYSKREKSEKSIDLLKTTCVGGSTIVAAGNGVRVLENEFKSLNIDLTKEYGEVEKLLNIHQMDDSHIGEGTQSFINTASTLGFKTLKMPKFIRDDECIQCGKCSFGCPKDAKWSSKDFIDEAIKNGATLICNADVKKVIPKNDRSIDIIYEKNDNLEYLNADKVVLAAGAVDTSVILQNSGIDSGNKLFFDPFISVGGVLKDINFNTEVQMNALVISEEYILSPHFSSFIPQLLNKELSVNDKDIFSIMVKIPDDMVGTVDNKGNVKKFNTIDDIRRISQGASAAGTILEKMGVDPTTISSTVFRGAHPGGTAAIGEVVDINLETEIKGLYVGDASVIPVSPGKPPILLILALALRLAKHIINNY